MSLTADQLKEKFCQLAANSQHRNPRKSTRQRGEAQYIHVEPQVQSPGMLELSNDVKLLKAHTFNSNVGLQAEVYGVCKNPGHGGNMCRSGLAQEAATQGMGRSKKRYAGSNRDLMASPGIGKRGITLAGSVVDSKTTPPKISHTHRETGHF